MHTTAGKQSCPKVALFGHFGQGNFGNDGSLQAMLHQLRRSLPGAEFSCICSDPRTVTATYGIDAVPSRTALAKSWLARGPLVRRARRLLVWTIGEPYQWLISLRTLRGTDALVFPGTGILHDTATFLAWGPYDVFRWSAAARLCRCRLLFVSMGAGPLTTRAGRFLVRRALSLASFRSYRDGSTLLLLGRIWPPAARDLVYPDLAFSLPVGHLLGASERTASRQIVGLGLMGPSGKYSAGASAARFVAYLKAFVDLAEWLLAHDYDIRLLLGDAMDTPTIVRFLSMLRDRCPAYDESRIINEPATSVDGLLTQLVATDLIVATRFHNVLFAMLLGKPVIAISFHDKCSSLMAQMDLSEFCHDINEIDSVALIEQFTRLSENAGRLRETIKEKVAVCSGLLDEQYELIAKHMAHDKSEDRP